MSTSIMRSIVSLYGWRVMGGWNFRLPRVGILKVQGCYSPSAPMHIKKQRFLTPGPTPLLPKALHAMMDCDVHHRTEDFRKVYSAVLRDLKEVMGTENDVLVLV